MEEEGAYEDEGDFPNWDEPLTSLQECLAEASTQTYQDEAYLAETSAQAYSAEINLEEYLAEASTQQPASSSSGNDWHVVQRKR
jgi:hypothetical protein